MNRAAIIRGTEVRVTNPIMQRIMPILLFPGATFVTVNRDKIRREYRCRWYGFPGIFGIWINREFDRFEGGTFGLRNIYAVRYNGGVIFRVSFVPRLFLYEIISCCIILARVCIIYGSFGDAGRVKHSLFSLFSRISLVYVLRNDSVVTKILDLSLLNLRKYINYISIFLLSGL